MIPIANADNKGFLIALVLVLALAVFSGSLRDKYVASGYATHPWGNQPARDANAMGYGTDFGSRGSLSEANVLCGDIYQEDNTKQTACVRSNMRDGPENNPYLQGYYS